MDGTRREMPREVPRGYSETWNMDTGRGDFAYDSDVPGIAATEGSP